MVRFVDYDGALYALKELPEQLAWREYRLLRSLEEQRDARRRGRRASPPDRGDELEASPDHPSPRLLPAVSHALRRGGVADLRHRLLDAGAELLVRLHLAGFFWGDCSLSNTLFRRDAGALTAYLVDAETGELHPTLTDGQRRHDLEIARENLVGELLDVGAEFGVEVEPPGGGDGGRAGRAATAACGTSSSTRRFSARTSATASTTGCIASTSSVSTSRSSS